MTASEVEVGLLTKTCSMADKLKLRNEMLKVQKRVRSMRLDTQKAGRQILEFYRNALKI